MYPATAVIDLRTLVEFVRSSLAACHWLIGDVGSLLRVPSLVEDAGGGGHCQWEHGAVKG